MPRKIYTAEQINWVRNSTPGKYCWELVGLFNAHFRTDEMTESKMRALMHNHKIRNGAPHKGAKRVLRLTTPKIDAMVRERFHDTAVGGFKEVQAYLADLGVEISLSQVKGYLARKKIRLGVYGYFKKGGTPANKGRKMSEETYKKCAPTMFKKGRRPPNWMPVGSERITTGGYREVKIAEPHKWKQLNRIVWEKEHGPIPKDHVLIFLDGNPLNCDISNLELITRPEHAWLNLRHLRFSEPELTKAGVLIAKLLAKSGQRKRGK